MATHEDFINNFNVLQDYESGEGKTIKRAIPLHVTPQQVPKHIQDAIGDLSDDQITTLNELAKKTGSHIFLHEHGNTKGKIIALGL